MTRLFHPAVLAAFILTTLPAAAQTAPRPKREPTPAQLEARERQQKCSSEWKEAKAAGKLPAGTQWPQFWSACNTRLKGTAV